MITGLCLLFVASVQRDIQDQIKGSFEITLSGKPLSGDAFHQALAPILSDGYPKFQHVLGDSRAILVTYTPTPVAKGGRVMSYRVFIWPDKDGNHAQVLQSYISDHATLDNSHTEGVICWKADTLVIAGWRETGFNPSTAELAYWRLVNGAWKQIQLIDSDADGDGYAAFSKTKQGLDITHVKVHVRMRPPNLIPPEIGPWVPFNETWTLKNGMYVRGTPKPEDTPLFQLELITMDAQSGNHKSFNAVVSAKAQKKLWHLLTKEKFLGIEDANADGPSDKTNRLIVDNKAIVEFGMKHGRWTVVRVSPYRS